MHEPPLPNPEATMRVAMPYSGAASLMLPGLILVGLLAAMAGQTGILKLPSFAPRVAGPEAVTIAARAYAYRATGDFLRDGAPVDGPVVAVEHPAPLQIMKYQVSESDYALCVADGACKKADPRRRGKGNLPVTGVNFSDATDYAEWLSSRTGATWRLPTVEEWTFAAGSKAGDPALGIETDGRDPAERWLAFYEKEAALGDNALATPEPLGSGGLNEYGVADVSGAVWEWTSTCATRTTLDLAGETRALLESCGVRYVEGKHRTAMTYFVRDSLTGGCSIGAPPDNLGFRLVREASWLERFL
ncbi:MAG: SUMF1/EgtB/PvdO family nonheme iron enzyme [Devosia sp.]